MFPANRICNRGGGRRKKRYERNINAIRNKKQKTKRNKNKKQNQEAY